MSQSARLDPEDLAAPAPPTGAGLSRPAGDLSALRIAFVSGNYNCLRDGANRAQNMLVRYLLDRGATVRVYSPTCDNPAFEPMGDLVSIPSSPLPFGRKEYRIAWHLPKVTRDDIRAFAPNLFHISLPLLHGRSALKLARTMDLPVVAAMHTRFETYPRYYGLGIFEKPLLAVLRRFYRACDKVVAPCESAAQTMQAQGMGENIGIWTRGVDTQTFSPARRDLEWRRAHGFGDEPVIAFLGRLVVEKGLGDFADTIARLRAENARFRILVIGDGPARAEFAERLRDAVFIGFQHGVELARAIASSDLLLNPSTTEAFGNVSLEAMACGVPVVAADATGNSNLVVDGLTGALVPPADVEGYTRAIARYLADPALRKAHAFNAHAHSQAFTWDRANAGIVEAYFAALASHTRPA
ncbi:glycosyltransferase family 4 protein [Novosphingobium mangrovi (ex Huang et al. 2023)]|uniref:Glycosyltransferase family 1 protein n=1 Tax=Novosphingobium mangrovi (ex Huang et al. 2023) TaxID=2976432 RepID=A0ABT2I774_9SPHN|nr:glycosyltransferase family 1 protein [Novosphingobium mangrovi (ex Huang et al. 2023)]MCT2400392.1 glycosyltransferase family 1 protein [Novosphingobium mangrovi (ex Huang et al. 2023)]